jgi:tetratricopeptide (TPR) repeat protein
MKSIIGGRQSRRCLDYMFKKRSLGDSSSVAGPSITKRVLGLGRVQHFRAAWFVVALGVLFGVWRVFFWRGAVNEGLLALRQAYSKERTLEGRLTALGYAPLRNTRAEPQSQTNLKELDRAERMLLDAAHEQAGARSSHALALFYLSTRQPYMAIKLINYALSQEPASARIHSDMGAALMEREQANERGDDARNGTGGGKRIEQLGRALEEIGEASKLDNSLLEAKFNRALCLQYLHLPSQAEDAWRRYLESDSHSGWAGEARKNLQAVIDQRSLAYEGDERLLQGLLQSIEARDSEGAWQILCRIRRSVGNTAENQLIDSFLDSTAKGDHEGAARTLSALTYAASLESQHARDDFASDQMRYYRTAGSARLSIVSGARAMMRSAYDDVIAARFGKAIDKYATSVRDLRNVGDECDALLAEFLIGRCYQVQLASEDAQRTLRPLLEIARDKHYRWLESRSISAMGFVSANQSKYSEAIKTASLALDLQERIYDCNGQLESLILLADIYQFINNTGKSLACLQRALVLTSGCSPDPMRIWGTYTGVVLNLLLLKLYSPALEFQKEALAVAEAMKRPLLMSRSLEYMAMVYGRLGRLDEAVDSVCAAMVQAGDLSDERQGTEIRAHASLYLAQLYREAKRFPDAIVAYNECIDLYNRLGSDYYGYVAHKGRASVIWPSQIIAALKRNSKSRFRYSTASDLR